MVKNGTRWEEIINRGSDENGAADDRRNVSGATNAKQGDDKRG